MVAVCDALPLVAVTETEYDPGVVPGLLLDPPGLAPQLAIATMAAATVTVASTVATRLAFILLADSKSEKSAANSSAAIEPGPSKRNRVENGTRCVAPVVLIFSMEAGLFADGLMITEPGLKEQVGVSTTEGVTLQLRFTVPVKLPTCATVSVVDADCPGAEIMIELGLADKVTPSCTDTEMALDVDPA